MSRSGYTADGTEWEMICWRGAVKSAIRGARGQAFLRQLLADLEAMPERKLCEWDLQRPTGECCTLGAAGMARGIDMTQWDPESHEKIAKALDIAPALVKEIEWENDEGGRYWYPEPKRDKETGSPLYEACEPTADNHYCRRRTIYKTNENGEPVNDQGITKKDWTDRQDELRWARMHEWVKSMVSDLEQQDRR